MRVKFDFNLQAWIHGIEIEGDSLEDCREKLWRMTAEEILEEGFVRESDISDIDHEIVEQEFHIKVSAVDYDVEDEDAVEEVERNYPYLEEDSEEWYEAIHNTVSKIKSELPQELDFVCECAPDCLEDEVCDCITDRTGFCIISCVFDIVEEEK